MSSKMADQDFTAGEDVLDQLMKRLDAEIEVFIKAKEPDANDLPLVTRSRDLKKADFTVQWAAFAAKRKMNPVAYVSELVEGLQAHVDQAKGLITKVQGVGPYLNLFVARCAGGDRGGRLAAPRRAPQPVGLLPRVPRAGAHPLQGPSEVLQDDAGHQVP